VAVLSLLRVGALPLRGSHQTGLDPELAQPQTLVLVQVDHRTRQQVVVMVSGMLEQMPAELLCERRLVVLEALVVLGAEPDGVLVGNVDPLDGRRLVGVHLLGELPCDLHGLHTGAEGAAEDTFDETLNAGFEVAQNADRRLLIDGLGGGSGRAAAKC
jgi:hypothetical protein